MMNPGIRSQDRQKVLNPEKLIESGDQIGHGLGLAFDGGVRQDILHEM
jgi:hypothetical protein